MRRIVRGMGWALGLLLGAGLIVGGQPAVEATVFVTVPVLRPSSRSTWPRPRQRHFTNHEFDNLVNGKKLSTLWRLQGVERLPLGGDGLPLRENLRRLP